MERIPLDKIILDPQLQPRETMRLDVVDEYAEVVDDLPPGKAVRNGDFIWLTEGWHRHLAHAKAGRKDMALEVTEGEWFDALTEACASNHGHGLRRTPEDKRRSVTNMLRNEDGAAKSDNWIAKICRVSNHLVAEIRHEMSSWAPEARLDMSNRKTSDGATRKAPAPRSRNKPKAAAGLPGPAMPPRLVQRGLVGTAPEQSDLKRRVQRIVHAMAAIHDELQQGCEQSDSVCRHAVERQRKKVELVLADMDLILHPHVNGTPTKADRDALFDAIVAATKADKKVNGGQIGKTVSLLLKAEPPYKPDEIAKFPAMLKRIWPKVPVTVGVVEKYVSWVRNGPPTSETELEKLRRELGK